MLRGPKPQLMAVSNLDMRINCRVVAPCLVAALLCWSCCVAASQKSLDSGAYVLSDILKTMNATAENSTYTFTTDVTLLGSPGTVIACEDNQLLLALAEGASLRLSNLSLRNTSLLQLPVVNILTADSVKKAVPTVPPALSFLQLPWLVLGDNSSLQLSSVDIVTDCISLFNYQSYVCGGNYSESIEVC